MHRREVRLYPDFPNLASKDSEEARRGRGLPTAAISALKTMWVAAL